MFLKPEESEGGQPIKPSGQYRAWINLLTSSIGEEIQRNSNHLGTVMFRYGTPPYISFYYYYLK
jgi:hypothetical protein